MIANQIRRAERRGGGLPLPFFAFEFNETSGTTLFDTGTDPQGRTATIDGATFILADLGGGKRGIEMTNSTHNGLPVTGTDIIVPYTSDRTIEARFFLDAFPPIYPIVCRLKSGTASQPFFIILSNQALYKEMTLGWGNTMTASGWKAEVGVTPAEGRWVHVIATTSGATQKVTSVYVDGVSIIRSPTSGWAGTTDSTMFGSYGSSPSSYAFDGKMDFIRVYDSALTGGQIADLYAAI